MAWRMEVRTVDHFRSTKRGEPMPDKTTHQVCLICGKPSSKTICDACSDRLRGEALEKKKKEEKI